MNNSYTKYRQFKKIRRAGKCTPSSSSVAMDLILEELLQQARLEKLVQEDDDRSFLTSVKIRKINFLRSHNA